MLLKELTALFGVTGHEDAVCAYVKEAAKPLCDAVTCDTMGSVYAFKKGKNPNLPHVMLSAHMDEVGFIVKGATDKGLLRFDCAGGIDARVIVSKRVLVGDSRVPGVIGAKAIHLQSAADMQKVLGYDKLYIDVGVKTKDEALKLCPVGAYAMFDSEYVEFGDELVKAKALDDRVGCLALLRALRESAYEGDLTCAFTVQEEVGLRGAEVAGYRVKPDLAIVLEGTTSNDLGDVPDHMKVTRVGKGVAISFMDRTSIADKGLVRFATGVADENGIAWQYKQFLSGGNDAGAIHQSRGGVPCVTFSVPCRYIHSPASVASLRDIRAQQELVLKCLEAMNAKCPVRKK